MDKKSLINRLVNRKLTSGAKGKSFCICMARNLCFAAGQQTSGAAAKK